MDAINGNEGEAINLISMKSLCFKDDPAEKLENVENRDEYKDGNKDISSLDIKTADKDTLINDNKPENDVTEDADATEEPEMAKEADDVDGADDAYDADVHGEADATEEADAAEEADVTKEADAADESDVGEEADETDGADDSNAASEGDDDEINIPNHKVITADDLLYIVTDYNILFNKHSEMYHPGENVTGKIVFDLRKKLRVSGLHMRIVCKMHINLDPDKDESETGDLDDPKGGHTITVFDQTETLFITENTAEECYEICEGFQEMDFSLKLPKETPSSLEGIHGSMRYFCYASFEGGQLEKPFTIKGLFSVYSELDLNAEEENLRCSVDKEDYINYTGCVKPGVINVLFRVDKSGYVPFEDLVAYVELDNKSRYTVLSTEVTINQHTEYDITQLNADIDEDDTTIVNKQDTTTVMCRYTKKGMKLRNGHHVVWDYEALIIPLCPPSKLQYCQFINIRYTAQLTVHTKNRSLTLEHDIIIGTCALKSLPDPKFLRVTDIDRRHDDAKEYNRQRRQEILSKKMSLHFTLHPAIVIPQTDGPIVPTVPDSIEV